MFVILLIGFVKSGDLLLLKVQFKTCGLCYELEKYPFSWIFPRFFVMIVISKIIKIVLVISRFKNGKNLLVCGTNSLYKNLGYNEKIPFLNHNIAPTVEKLFS